MRVIYRPALPMRLEFFVLSVLSDDQTRHVDRKRQLLPVDEVVERNAVSGMKIFRSSRATPSDLQKQKRLSCVATASINV
jgi:hypothetical protein